MTENKRTATAYLEAFARTARPAILECLTDDVAWDILGVFSIHGKQAFNEHIVDGDSARTPGIAVTRPTEEHDIVIAEGSVHALRNDGTYLDLDFCDVFEMRDGKISQFISYRMPTPPPDGTQ